MILTALLLAQITISEYAARRAALAEDLRPDAVLLVLGAPEPAEDYLSFEQNPPFTYLTGVNEPDAALIMVGRGPSLLFVEPKDPTQEVWSGARMGPAGATKRTGLSARPRADLEEVLDSLLQTHTRLLVSAPPSDQATLMRAHPGVTLMDAGHSIDQLRGRKSAAELALLARAAGITSDGVRAAFSVVSPGVNEYEVQARIEYTFRVEGADRPSFASVVGSGPNTTVLHYNADNRVMQGAELVVMDVGASYHGYAGDVTRTVPVNGHYTADQLAIYRIVRDAQAAAERQAVLDAPARRMSDSAVAVLAAGLARLGLIESDSASYDCGNDRQCAQWALYYMHLLGHGIGLEVHDPEQFYVTGRIAIGSAFTIEPGLYVRANLPTIVPDTPRNRAMLATIGPGIARYANIGVRIEDDYIATSAGVRRISNAPREATEIEAIMQRPRFRGESPTSRASP